MAYTTTSDSIVIKATLTDKGRKLLSRGRFKVAKFTFGDDEIDYGLIDVDKIQGTHLILTDPANSDEVETYVPALKNSKMLEANSDRRKNILYGLNSYDEGTLYLEKEEIDAMEGNLHAHILYLPNLKINEKLTLSPTISGSMYYLSVNDETSEQLDTIDNFKFLTTNRLENVKLVIESGIEKLEADLLPTMDNRREKIIKKFLLDFDYFLYADNKFFRKMVGITPGSQFENFPSGETIINFKTGQESPPISYESEFDGYATFISKGVQNLILAHDSEGTPGFSGAEHSAHSGPRGSVIAVNPLIDQELQASSTAERDFRYTEYGYTDQIVFSELPTKKFDYIDTTIYIIGGTTNSRVRVPIRLIRYVGT